MLLFIVGILCGIDTTKRFAVSTSIIDWIIDYLSLAFLTTHDIELIEMWKDQCDNVHF